MKHIVIEVFNLALSSLECHSSKYQTSTGHKVNPKMYQSKILLKP